jgi:ABC-type Fe3+-hydroxamate transport system substrate-binding protein
LLFGARRKRKLIGAFMLIAAAVLISGCGGKSAIVVTSNSASQTYPVTITATSGSITHQLVVNVTLSR